MERFQLENLYRVNNLDDFKLKTTDDLLKCHGINYKQVDGYSNLDDLNRQLYEKFIVNIYNNFGLDTRATLIAKGIYYVEDIKLLYKDKEDDPYTVIGGIIYNIDRNGNKRLLHKWKDKDYKGIEPIKDNSSYYLRFEYVIDNRNEWLHVIKEHDWY